MPRYFFHLTGCRSFIDREGVELADDDAAWSAAVLSCGEILRDIDGHLPERSEIVIRVADDGGGHIATLRFLGRRQLEIALADVADRIADQLDVTLDWITDVYKPSQFNAYAHDLALAAIAGLEEGDEIGRGLIVSRTSSA